MRVPLFLFIVFMSVKVKAQQTVTFPSEDSVLITADHYLQDKEFPYILLFHQANSSRGEYLEAAQKLLKLGYNCLAVDLRSGKEINYIQNETAARAAGQKLPTSYLDSEKDILASIEYVKQLSSKKIILFGSSYSASLVMKIGNHNPGVAAVIAFSPGEYFQPRVVLKSCLSDYDKPIYVTSTLKEKPFVQELISEIPTELSNFMFRNMEKGFMALKLSGKNNRRVTKFGYLYFYFLRKLRLNSG